MKKTSKDFFESISEFPHSIGIYLTYTLDNEVIDKLTEFSSGTKLILHDFKQGKIIDDNDNSNIICLPIKTLKITEKNCFHAKLALLKGEVSAKLIVGSANLSRDSFEREKETAIEITLQFNNSSDVYIYKKVIEFFNQLTGKTDKEKRQLLTSNNVFETTLEYLKYPALPKKKSDIDFVFNSESKSIFDELKNYLAVNRKSQIAEKIKIATPFVSEAYPEIEEIKAIAKNISIYLRTGAVIKTFSDHQFEIRQPKSKKSEGFHSKLFLIEYKSDAVLYIGSANFTQQGFFKTLNESANQECGIILKVTKDEMNEWFSESYWKKLTAREIADSVEAEDNSLEFLESQSNFYAWAEKENNKVVTYIFNPERRPVSKTKDSNRIQLVEVDKEFLFKTEEFEAQNQKVTFYIGEEKISTPVFEMNEYIAGLNEKGESIFSSFKGLYSVNPKEMDEAIDKDKLSASASTTIKITEPPKLEQYFYNVKDLLSNIRKKEYFSATNEIEIINLLNGVKKLDDYFNLKPTDRTTLSNDCGRYIYLALQLLKVLDTKPISDSLKLFLNNKILELSEHEVLQLSKSKLNTFKKVWLTSKT